MCPTNAGFPTLGVQICLEILFPNFVRQQVVGGAEILLNLTNDAWFGTTSAPYQHFAEAVLRAVEMGRWVVRSANTGISGIIAPSGRVVARSELNESVWLQGVVVPRRSPTVYVRIGDAFAWACVVISLVALVTPGMVTHAP